MSARGGIGLVGVSHHTAPVEVRERFAFGATEADDVLERLAEHEAVDEAVLLSTCNRTELYVHGDGDAALDIASGLLEQRAMEAAGGAAASHRYLYHHRQRHAVRHLFRVVTSLDSMVLGEAQIQGQVKGAYESARELGEAVMGPNLSRLFETALRVGGSVRSETALGMGAASVPSAAIRLARKIFGSLEGRRALVLGAGEMSALALDCLLAEGARSVVVANRTVGRAQELVERTGGAAIPFEELVEWLPETDIIATATAAPHAMLTREMVRRALPRGARRPLCIIDMALPRDVEPAVADIENVFLYDVDDLQQIVDDNLERRQAEIPTAEQLVEEAVADYWDWYMSRDVVPVIRALREHAEQARVAELERLLRRMPELDQEQRALIDEVTRRLMNKMLHAPTVRLRESAANGGARDMARAARYLFELDRETDEG